MINTIQNLKRGKDGKKEYSKGSSISEIIHILLIILCFLINACSILICRFIRYVVDGARSIIQYLSCQGIPIKWKYPLEKLNKKITHLVFHLLSFGRGSRESRNNRFATGGVIPKTDDPDQVKRMLENGWYSAPPETIKHYGKGMMDALNNKRVICVFKDPIEFDHIVVGPGADMKDKTKDIGLRSVEFYKGDHKQWIGPEDPYGPDPDSIAYLAKHLDSFDRAMGNNPINKGGTIVNKIDPEILDKYMESTKGQKAINDVIQRGIEYVR